MGLCQICWMWPTADNEPYSQHCCSAENRVQGMCSRFTTVCTRQHQSTSPKCAHHHSQLSPFCGTWQPAGTSLQNNKIRSKKFHGLRSNTVELVAVNSWWLIADSDSVLGALEDCLILQSLILSSLSSHSMGSPDPELPDTTLFVTVF